MRFLLVQRLCYRPKPQGREESPLEKLAYAFGGGRLSDDYAFDYMGSSEFEFGAIPKARKRLTAARQPMMATHEFVHPDTGHVSTLEFVWRGEDGEPFADWDAWVKGGMRTKESSYELAYRLRGEKPHWWDADRQWETAIYWSLDDAVMWSFAGEGHLARLLGLDTQASSS